jgi:hypothetical protein
LRPAVACCMLAATSCTLLVASLVLSRSAMPPPYRACAPEG